MSMTDDRMAEIRARLDPESRATRPRAAPSRSQPEGGPVSATPGIKDVQCPRCKAAEGEKCVTPSGKAADFHMDRWSRLKRDERSLAFVVRLLHDDPTSQSKAGTLFVARIYWLDSEKITLLRRLSDGMSPECNAYARNVEYVRWARSDELPGEDQ